MPVLMMLSRREQVLEVLVSGSLDSPGPYGSPVPMCCDGGDGNELWKKPASACPRAWRSAAPADIDAGVEEEDDEEGDEMPTLAAKMMTHLAGQLHVRCVVLSIAWI